MSRIENSSTHIRSFTTDGTDSTSSATRNQTVITEKPKGNVVEAFGGALSKQAPSADQKDVFGAVFNLLGGLFNPKSQAGGQPTFDLGKILTDVLGVAENLFGKDLDKAAEQAMGSNPTKRAKNAPDKAGYVGTGKERTKIVPGASDGVRGIKDEGQLNIEGAADLGGGTKAKGSVKGGTFSGVTSDSSAGIDAEGNLYAQGGFAAGAGVRVRAEGEIEGSWGNVKGGVGAEAQVYAHGRASALVNTKGAQATATAGVGAIAGVNADAEANIGDGLFRGAAKADAKAGTGADASATATATYSPLQAAFSGQAGAFAGARATCEAKGTFAGVGYKIGAEAWAGVGAKIGIDAGIKDGKFKFEMNVGVALGVGAAVTVGFEIDTKDIFSVAKGLIGAAGALLGGILKPVGDAVGAITKPVGDVFGGVMGAVGGLFGGGKGTGAAASETVDFFGSLAKTASGLFDKPKGTETETSAKPAGSTEESEETDEAPEARPLQDAPLPDTTRAYA
jgi:hypothetical protein